MSGKKEAEHMFIVFDGRASYSIDEGTILECLPEGMALKGARKVLGRHYKDMDAALVRFDIDENKNLVNGEVLP